MDLSKIEDFNSHLTVFGAENVENKKPPIYDTLTLLKWTDRIKLDFLRT